MTNKFKPVFRGLNLYSAIGKPNMETCPYCMDNMKLVHGVEISLSKTVSFGLICACGACWEFKIKEI